MYEKELWNCMDKRRRGKSGGERRPGGFVFSALLGSSEVLRFHPFF
jgi:hypothetical protein